MRQRWRRFLAYWRLDLAAVCEQSVGKDAYHDYHDYPDDIQGYPWHMMELKCKRCGKGFYI